MDGGHFFLSGPGGKSVDSLKGLPIFWYTCMSAHSIRGPCDLVSRLQSCPWEDEPIALYRKRGEFAYSSN